MDEYTLSKDLLDADNGKEVINKFLSTYRETLDKEKSLEAADNIAERNGLRHFMGLWKINQELDIILKVYSIIKNYEQS